MADTQLLLSLGKVVHFAKDQTVFMQDDPGDSMYIVLKGIFGVYINSFSSFPLRVAGIQQGSFFGEMSVIDGWPRSATIIAEEDGAALAVDSGNFGLLLDKAPDMANSIFNTLISRVQSTADAVRQAGGTTTELPPHLMEAQFQNAKSSLAFMVMLAEQIRDMNTLLTGPADDEPPPEPQSEPAEDVITLLPEGYVSFNIDEQDDTRSMLHVQSFNCPYCSGEIKSPVPIFSALKQKSSALDGRIVYDNFDILRYTNIVCPRCYFTDTYQEFGKPKPSNSRSYERGDQFKNKENFTGYINPGFHTLDETIKSYYLNIACLTATTGDPLRFARAWIRLYWLYCDYGRRELASQAAYRAFHFFNRYREKSSNNIPGKDLIRLNATLGELAAALGDSEKAMAFYKENTTMKGLNDDEFVKLSQKRLSKIKRM